MSPTVESTLVYVRCNLCGSDDPEVIYRLPVQAHRAGLFARDVWDYVRCGACGLVYMNPRPDEAGLNRFYTFETEVDRDFIQDWFVGCAEHHRPTWRRYLRAIGRYCPSGRLLDVGCGAGTFLVEARRAGYEVAGQDISPRFVEYCRGQHGLDVFDTPLEHVPLEPGSLDCVTAFDVIEHHPDPHGMLREMRALLKPGGLAVISTHDIGNLFARLYGRRWRHLHPFHLTFFTRQTLARMMAASGFDVVHQGGSHTVDGSTLAEQRNRVVQFFRAIVLRGLVLGLYKPLATRVPALTRWRLRWGNDWLGHQELLLRTGSQVIVDDDMVLLALAK